MERSIKYTHSAGGVVINEKGEVVVVSQGGRTWSLPKGHIDDGETPIQAAIREIYEECGIKQLDMIYEFPSYERPLIGKSGIGEDSSEIKKLTFFLFKTSEKILKPIDPHNPEARWVAKEKVAELLTHPKDKEFFLGIINKI